MSHFSSDPTSQPDEAGVTSGTPSSTLPSNEGPQTSTSLPLQRKWSKRTRIFLIVLVILVLGAGGGLAVFGYLSTRPQPIIHLTSRYTQGTIPVGATGTTFKVSGQNFPGQVPITFLLDGLLAPGTTSRQSASNGEVSSTLMVTAAWPTGKHMVSARVTGSAPTRGVMILIVAPGEANTPGPNGAPPNSARGSIVVTMQPSISSRQLNLQMNKGTVCGSEDDEKMHTFSQTSGVPLSGFDTALDTFSATCLGTYQGGRLSYIETITSETIDYGSGITCSADKPYQMHLEGTFTGANTIVGTSSTDAFTWHCVITPDPGQTYGWAFNINGKPSSQKDVESPTSVGTWTGLVSLS